MTLFIEVRTIRTVLDIGCSTGGHAIPLTNKMGYKVLGIDKSKIMLRQAIKRASLASVNIDFKVRDLRNFDLARKFDACIAMFNVVGRK